MSENTNKQRKINIARQVISCTLGLAVIAGIGFVLMKDNFAKHAIADNANLKTEASIRANSVVMEYVTGKISTGDIAPELQKKSVEKCVWIARLDPITSNECLVFLDRIKQDKD